MIATRQAHTVLDASALIEVLLRTDAGQWFRDRLGWTQEFHAPELVVVEAAAVLRRYELRAAIFAERADVAFDRMIAIPMSCHRRRSSSCGTTVTLAAA